jgi:hypothetical protein
VGIAYRNGTTEGLGLPADWTDESKAAARLQLTRILESPHFRSSKRCSLFLRYVVEHTIDGLPEPLKERTLGIEIFGRDALYDTAQDPVVRTTAGEVRKRLAQYYLESGLESARVHEMRISLPAGAYVPEIHWPSEAPPPPENGSNGSAVPDQHVVAPTAVVAPPKSFGWWTVATVLGSVAVVVLLLLIGLRFRTTDLDRFWAPFVKAPQPVTVCVGQPRAYLFNQRVQSALDRWFEASAQDAVAGKSSAKTAANPAGIASIALEDIVPAWDRHISITDAGALTQIFSLLVQKGQKVQLRGVRQTSLADLRGKPCVLVGGFNNDWNLGLTGELRYYFENGDEADFVRDRTNPGKSDWKVINTWPYTHPPTDYAIVSRVVNSTTEQTVVTIAGITGFGTQAAGEFLTNESYLAEALKQAPTDWARKNMQVVLSTRVMSGAAGPPQVLAVHFW